MKERLKAVIGYLQKERYVHNNADFANIVGVHASFLSEILNGKRSITEKFLHRICEAFPQINYTWLSEGVGEMCNVGGAIMAGKKEEPLAFSMVVLQEIATQQTIIVEAQKQITHLLTFLDHNRPCISSQVVAC